MRALPPSADSAPPGLARAAWAALPTAPSLPDPHWVRDHSSKRSVPERLGCISEHIIWVWDTKYPTFTQTCKSVYGKVLKPTSIPPPVRVQPSCALTGVTGPASSAHLPPGPPPSRPRSSSPLPASPTLHPHPVFTKLTFVLSCSLLEKTKTKKPHKKQKHQLLGENNSLFYFALLFHFHIIFPNSRHRRLDQKTLNNT